MKQTTLSTCHCWLAGISLTVLPGLALASGDAMHPQNFTSHWAGWLAIGIFVLAYALVIGEEALHLRKSKPTMVAAGFIWLIVALLYIQAGDIHTAEIAVRHNLEEFGELFLFLLAAMTYINTMEERGVFDTLRTWLIGRGFSLRKIFWITGGLAFVISPIADNLTTALLMATVAMAVGGSDHRFVAVACINIVVAANAGGAFSPFGDITTLMVWQKGIIQFQEFFALFVPSVVNWLVPAVILGMTVPSTAPQAQGEAVELKHGAWVVVGLFILTIGMAVSAHNFLHLPPVLGMMTGLGLLKFFGYFLKITGEAQDVDASGVHAVGRWDIFNQLQRAEWDTLMFFYGVILCVGGLGALGYLALVSESLFVGLGVGWAAVIVGVLSAIVDNIPVMFAVLSMNPEMNIAEWLLVTLTAGVGGSLLSVGSAAGVALMGQARGIYTFFAHLKWSWAIALGYVASIMTHFMITGLGL